MGIKWPKDGSHYLHLSVSFFFPSSTLFEALSTAPVEAVMGGRVESVTFSRVITHKGAAMDAQAAWKDLVRGSQFVSCQIPRGD